VCKHRLRLYEYTQWTATEEVPGVRATLEFIEELRSWREAYRSGDDPTMAYSSCGGTNMERAALLCTLWWAMEQAEEEGVVDIFNVVRLVRTYVPAAVLTQVTVAREC